MKIIKWLDDNLEAASLIFMLCALTALVMLQIFMRYVLGTPLSWSEELCRMLLVWSGFFSIGYCAKKVTTIRLDTILLLMPVGMQRVVMTITTLLMITLLVFLANGAFTLVKNTANIGSVMAGLLIPQYWLYVGPLLGLCLGAFRFAQYLITSRFFSNLADKGEN